MQSELARELGLIFKDYDIGERIPDFSDILKNECFSAFAEYCSNKGVVGDIVPPPTLRAPRRGQ